MSTVLVEYKFRNSGPRVTTWGEKPLLIYLYNLIDGKKIQVDNQTLNPNHFFQFGRQWFTNWLVEIFEWNAGNLVKIHTDVFSPYGKKTNFHLAEFDTLEEHIEYAKACIEYINHWDISEYSIESPFAFELKEIYPEIKFSHKILDPEMSYVSYEIKKTPSSYFAYENFGVSLLNEEVVNYNNHHPYSPEGVSSYEFAKSILFGPDYKKIERYIPQDWTLINK